MVTAGDLSSFIVGPLPSGGIVSATVGVRRFFSGTATLFGIESSAVEIISLPNNGTATDQSVRLMLVAVFMQTLLGCTAIERQCVQRVYAPLLLSVALTVMVCTQGTSDLHILNITFFILQNCSIPVPAKQCECYCDQSFLPPPQLDVQ